MVKERPWEELLAAMVGRKPFTYSRWGSDEWHCLFGERNGFLTQEGHVYFHSLCHDLSRLMQSRPPYALGLADTGDKIDSYILGCGLGDLDWCRHQSPGADQIIRLFEAVTKTSMIVIGPPPLRKLRRLLGFHSFVEVPPKNAYLRKDDIVRNALAVLSESRYPSLVTVSAGVCTPLIVDELYRRPESQRHRLVDVGNLWQQLVR